MVVRKIKASSLIETIVAMIVLVLVFLFSVMIVNNVMQSAFLGAKTKATLKMYTLLEETKRDKSYLDDEITYGNYTIKKQIEVKKENEVLIVLEFILEDEHQHLITRVKEEVLLD